MKKKMKKWKNGYETPKHPKNALFSQIALKQIYFWPNSIKGSYLEYQKPHGEDGHWTLAWRLNWMTEQFCNYV